MALSIIFLRRRIHFSLGYLHLKSSSLVSLDYLQDHLLKFYFYPLWLFLMAVHFSLISNLFRLNYYLVFFILVLNGRPIHLVSFAQILSDSVSSPSLLLISLCLKLMLIIADILRLLWKMLGPLRTCKT